MNKFKLTIKNFATVPILKSSDELVDLRSIKRELGFDQSFLDILEVRASPKQRPFNVYS
jgi:hypothetical protein